MTRKRANRMERASVERIKLAVHGYAMTVAAFLASHSVEVGVLVLLTMLNTGSTLLLRYSRGVRKETYSASVGVLGVEVLKFAVSAFMVARQRPQGTSVSQAYAATMRTALPSALPAVLYSVQNGLAYIALQTLEAGVYSVLVQLRLLTTGLFSVLFLKRHLTAQHWRALLVLVVSVVLVEAPGCSSGEPSKATAAGQRTGVICVLCMALLSSFSGVYWEKVLKGSHGTVWERNFQLALFSIIVALATIGFQHPADLLPQNLLRGVTGVTLVLLTCQASQGIVTAFVTKITNTIIRNYSSTASLCITAILSVWLFGAKLDLLFWLGLVLVLTSMSLYNEASANQTLLAGLRQALQEKQQQEQQQQQQRPSDSVAVQVETTSSA